MKNIPTYRINSVFEIATDFLKKENIKTLIFDADATLIQQKSYNISFEMIDKLNEIINSGTEVFIASNGKTGRITEVFSKYNIKVYSMCLKPLPFKLNRILKKYDKETTAIVGDQFFTDMLCAKFLKIRSFFTLPYGTDTDWFMKFKRKLERKILGDK